MERVFVSMLKSIIMEVIIFMLRNSCHFHKSSHFINHALQLENGNLLLDIDENLVSVTQVRL